LWRSAGPAIDVSESDKELVVTVEVPGVNENDIEVTLADNMLTVQGEKKAEREQKGGETSYLERRYGAFSRSIRLPFSMKDEEVNATYDKGVLTITKTRGGSERAQDRSESSVMMRAATIAPFLSMIS
jgi:HSP20 family protein